MRRRASDKVLERHAFRLSIPEIKIPVATAADELEAECLVRAAAKKAKKKSLSIGPARLAKLGAEAAEAFRAGDCSELQPVHFVGVYCFFHEKVYGVPVVDELRGPAAAGASSLAKRMLERQFAGDPDRMADFFRWAWARERTRESKRRHDGIEGSRISWRFMFGGAYLLNDYRVHLSRTGG